MEAYSYEKIPSTGWLRLLNFVVDDSAPLKCDLTSYEFSNAPRYHALSYYWGDGRQTTHLECDKGSIEITHTLNHALLRLRKLSQGGNVFHFWVDQVCINQTDTEERMHQVLLMKTIYSRSERTLIWLPFSDDQDIPDALDFFFELQRAIANSEGKGLIDEEEHKALGLPAFDSPMWSRVEKLLANPWFRRTWVVQEAALSPVSPLILCGDVELDFDKFYDTVQWIEIRMQPRLMAEVSVPATITLIGRVRSFSDTATGERHPWRMEAILRMANHLRSTDPRDRIYGLLGLTNYGRGEAGLETVLRPDYGRDVVDLYTSVTRYCIEQSQRLYILGSGGVDTERDSPFPSWVPRWDCPRRSDILLGGPHKLVSDVDEALGEVDIEDLSPYAACLGQPPIIATPGDPHEIILGGIYADSISWRSDIQVRETGKETAQTIRELWERSADHLDLLIDPEDRQFRDFASSFSMAVSSGLALRRQWEFRKDDSSRNFFCFLTSCYEKNPPALAANRRAVGVYRSLGQGGDPLDMGSHLPGRRLFITQAGRVGSGPATLQVGDEIFVLLGGAMPYVLRPNGTHYTMVGETFLHGLMEGELFLQWVRKEVEGEWVRLR